MALSYSAARATAQSVSVRDPHKAVRLWLLAVAALVLAMVTVGGATRLTGSGLSITEWKPILGAIPPLSAADWQDAFDKYRQITQYKVVNRGMSLDAFQFIYWWEWGHRQLGRLIGLAYLVPLLIFLSRKQIPDAVRGRLWALFALGGLQGAMGWYMVQSGLTDRVDVSQYRLALHLTLAAVIFAGLLWVALDLSPSVDRVRLKALPQAAVTMSGVVLAVVFLQIFLGALVAGLKAGFSHNTWPLMDGRLIPDGLFIQAPWWKNLFENVLTVQFNHRLVAYVLVGLGIWQGIRVARVADDEQARRSGLLLAAIILVQVVLGIWTLLAAVPLWLGLVHQAMAMAVLAAAVWHRHAALRA